jgi:hypothetical protein
VVRGRVPRRPDNMSSVVTEAEATAPRLNDTLMEYAQSRGFEIDAARVATPKDKASASDCTSMLVDWEEVVAITTRHRRRGGRTQPAALRRTA